MTGASLQTDVYGTVQYDGRLVGEPGMAKLIIRHMFHYFERKKVQYVRPYRQPVYSFDLSCDVFIRTCAGSNGEILNNSNGCASLSQG